MGVSAWVAVAVVAAACCCPSEVAGQANACFPGELFELPEAAFARKVQQFSYSFFNQLSSRSGTDNNVFVSPYSVWSVLSLAYFGAEGNTKAQMDAALDFTTKTATLSNWNVYRLLLEGRKSDARLNVANRAYFADFLHPFLNRCLTSQLFDLNIVDFTRGTETLRAINADINATTEGRIPNLIHFMSPQTRFALVNAVFFKGTWETQFDPRLTKRHDFWVPPGVKSGVVPMMNRTDFMRWGSVPALEASMLELPYLNSNVSMFLLLPDNGLTPLHTLISRLNPTTFQQAYDNLSPFRVHLLFPKFKMSIRIEEELQTALENMGIVDLFDASRANLTAFIPSAPPLSDPLYVDTAIHQATIEVNEEGTIATAATAFINTRFGSSREIRMVFNRPFVLLIVDKLTKLPLFMGKISTAANFENL